MLKNGLALTAVVLVAFAAVALKAAPTSETPEAPVQSYLEGLRSTKPDMVSLKGRFIHGEPYVTNILLVKAQTCPERTPDGNAQTWRVLYSVETKLTPEFVQDRLANLQTNRVYEEAKLRNQPAKFRLSIDELYRGSIERVRTGRYVVYATAMVTHTPTGWQLAPLAARQIDVDIHAWALNNYWSPTGPFTTKATAFGTYG